MVNQRAAKGTVFSLGESGCFHTLMLGKIEGRRRRGATEDEIAGWHQPTQWT